MPKHIQLTIAVAIQTLIIIAMIFFKLLILGSGTEVLLHIQPVDPRDPLRGDYLTFSYDISTASFYSYNSFDYTNNTRTPLRNGEIVYVTLYKSGDYWTNSLVSRTIPNVEDVVFIRGVVQSGGQEPTYMGEQDQYSSSDQSVQIKYGIEEFFIPEGTGWDINSDVQSGKASAVVRIDDHGNAVLKQIYIDGKPWPR